MPPDSRFEALRARARTRARRLSLTELRGAIARTECVATYVRSDDARATFAALAEEYRLEVEKRQRL